MGEKVTPEYVTDVADRKPLLRSRFIFGMWSGDEDGVSIDYWHQFSPRDEFTFRKWREGYFLLQQVRAGIRDRDESAVSGILKQIEALRLPFDDEKTPDKIWGDMAVQLPGDWGPDYPYRAELKTQITQKAGPRVLEAMCGFNSYFSPAPHIQDVTALDFCREALERYEYPERPRILYNLDRVGSGERMDFFDDASFNTIGVFFWC